MENTLIHKDGKKNKKVKILCASRAGVATCSRITSEVKKFLSKNHLEFEIMECMASDIDCRCKDIDLVISMTQLPPKIGKPVISGVPFMTGNKLESTKKEILRILKG